MAEDFQDGKYIELKFGDIACGQILTEYFLVKADTVRKQLDLDKPIPAIKPEDTNSDDDSDSKDSTPPSKPNPLPTHFSMDVELDIVRYARELKNYIDEIASYLMNLPNVETSIRVAIDISIPEGVPVELEEIVTENCHVLRIGAEHFHFEL